MQRRGEIKPRQEDKVQSKIYQVDKKQTNIERSTTENTKIIQTYKDNSLDDVRNTSTK